MTVTGAIVVVMVNGDEIVGDDEHVINAIRLGYQTESMLIDKYNLKREDILVTIETGANVPEGVVFATLKY